MSTGILYSIKLLLYTTSNRSNRMHLSSHFILDHLILIHFVLKSMCSYWSQCGRFCGHIVEMIVMYLIVLEVGFVFWKFIFWSFLSYFSVYSMTHYTVLNFCSEDNEYIEIQVGICIFQTASYSVFLI